LSFNSLPTPRPKSSPLEKCIRFSDGNWRRPPVRSPSTSPRAATGRPVAGRFGRDRLQHYRIAYGSCQEAKTTVEILVNAGHLERETGRRWWADLHRVGGLLWGLMKSLQ